MDDTMNYSVVEDILGTTYATVAFQNRNSLTKKLSKLLHQRCVPDEGWDELSIELLLHELTVLDLNNANGVVGIGEREGRVFSNLIKKRYYYASHGIGRSGNLMELQPKAVGSSLLNRLTQYLSKDILRHCGLKAISDCVVLPVATGMALHLCYCQLRRERPKAQFIIWSRIDQKSCIKAIISAGFQLVVVPMLFKENELITDITGIEDKIKEIGEDNILCISTTTSAFAPRSPDNIPAIAQLCQQYSIPQVVNNAYGLQCSKCVHLIEVGSRTGRVDYIVQSTDKNFLVPVGGSIVASPSKRNIEALCQLYPGRASIGPTLDLFVTLMQLGRKEYDRLRAERKRIFSYFKSRIQESSIDLPLKLLSTPNNGISFMLDVSQISNPTQLGSALYHRRCSGSRVVVCTPQASISIIEGIAFKQFGAHNDNYPTSYMTVACALGITDDEVDEFIDRLTNLVRVVKYTKDTN